jgi:signal transduction histidine kinase
MVLHFRQGKQILWCLLFSLGILGGHTVKAQVKQMVQVKTFDQQLKPYKNLDLMLNDKVKVTTDAKGAAFIELNESELPIRSVEIKSEGVETASWNFSKGAVEIIVRKKNYKLVTVTITDAQRQPLVRTDIVFTGTRKINLRTNTDGNIYVPLTLDERITTPDQFAVAGYVPTRLTTDNGAYVLYVDRIRAAPVEETKQAKPLVKTSSPSRKSYEKEVANLDTVRSLASFYQLVRNMAMNELSAAQKNKVDAKFNDLVKRMQASQFAAPPVTRVITKESIRLPAEVSQLKKKLEEERRQLDMQRTEDKLAQSKEAQLKEQEEILIAGTSVVVVASLLVLLITSRRKARRQKEELILANSQITQLYEDFEGKVAERTTSLNEINNEMEVLLRRAAQDLQVPIASLYDIGHATSAIATRELISKTVDSARVMDNLVKNLAVISEFNQPKHLTEINVCQVLQKVKKKFEPTLQENNIQNTWVCDDSIRFKAYPVFFEVMLTKLVENAVFFGLLREKPEGQRTIINVSFQTSNKEVVLMIEDNGIGINEKIRPQIFQMFFKGSEKSRGSGLGLFIVSRCVWHMQGSIKVDTKEDRFTRFTIRLPERG